MIVSGTQHAIIPVIPACPWPGSTNPTTQTTPVQELGSLGGPNGRAITCQNGIPTQGLGFLTVKTTDNDDYGWHTPPQGLGFLTIKMTDNDAYGWHAPPILSFIFLFFWH